LPKRKAARHEATRPYLIGRLGTDLQHSFLPFDVSGPKSFFSAPNIGPRFQAVLRPFLWSPQFNAHKLARFRVVARAESALLLNNDHCPDPQNEPVGREPAGRLFADLSPRPFVYRFNRLACEAICWRFFFRIDRRRRFMTAPAASRRTKRPGSQP
jgi:hypothetical protein